MSVQQPGLLEVPIENPQYLSGKSSNGSKWEILVGDVIEKLKTMDDKSVDCITTSPPYFWLRDYGIDGQIGLEDGIDEYVDKICKVMDQCHRVLKADGVLFLNLGDTYYSGRGESKGVDAKSSKRRFGLRSVDRGGGMGKGIKGKSILGMPWRIALKMIEQGWILRSPIIWNRVSCLPESVKDRPLRQFEYLFMFVKSRKYKFDRSVLDDASEEDIWNIDVNGVDGSVDTKSAPYPIELAERCIKISTNEGDTVLDPFMGSGTTLVAASINKRNSIGIDINKDFCQYAERRLLKI